jgi:hypothetical protein
MSSGSSLFGSQVSLHDPIATQAEETPRAGSSSTADARSKWKTLRDFVDEKGIEDALERMEADRIALDVIFAAPAYFLEYRLVLTFHRDLGYTQLDSIPPNRSQQTCCGHQGGCTRAAPTSKIRGGFTLGSRWRGF